MLDPTATDAQVFQFPAELTIYQVQDTLGALRDAWLAGARCFDVSALTQVDGSGAQLLASLAKTAIEQNDTIEWNGWTPEATETLTSMGLAPLLQMAKP